MVEKKEPDSLDTRWYNLYSDGWCEQGQNYINSSLNVISFLKSYSNTLYDIIITPTYGTNNTAGTRGCCTFKKTATGFLAQSDSNSTHLDWVAYGYTSTNIGKTIIKY